MSSTEHLREKTDLRFPGEQAEDFREVHQRLNRFRLRHKFAIDEVTTKIAILRKERDS